MRKFLNSKYKVVLLILISVFLLSAVSLAAVGTASKYVQKQKDVTAADLTISDLEDLKNFANEVRGGNSYSGKVVQLDDDIDCGGEEIKIGKTEVITDRVSEGGTSISYTKTVRSYFYGTFLGNGYTISNVNYTTNNHSTDYTGGEIEYNTDGLFVNNGGVIKDLKLLNFYMFINDGGSASMAGSIVGYNTGTLESCIVENIKFISDRYQSYCTVGSIVGQNKGTVKNCLVQGYYEIGGYSWNVLSNDDGVSASYFVGNGTNEAIYCVFKANVTKIEKTSCVQSPSEYDTEALNNNNYSTAAEAEEGLTSNYLCSSVGGADITIWYYAADDFNAGWPYLRSFIKRWYKCGIRSAMGQASYGSVSPSDGITIPYESISVLGNKFKDKTSSSIIAFNNTFEAVPVAGYLFEKWSWSGGTTIYANFIEETYIFEFSNTYPSGSATPYAPSTESITVKYNQNITVNTIYTAENTIIEIKVGGQTVTYTLNVKYTINSYGSINYKKITNNMTVPDLENNETYSISPTIKLKSYSSIFI